MGRVQEKLTVIYIGTDSFVLKVKPAKTLFDVDGKCLSTGGEKSKQEFLGNSKTTEVMTTSGNHIA